MVTHRSFITVVLASAIASTILFARTVSADIVWTQDGTVHYGKIIQQDQRSLQLRGNDGQIKTLPRSTIARVHRNVDEARLKLLSAEKPNHYFLYAEELAAEKKDPFAKRLAVQLLRVAIILTDEAEPESTDAQLHQSALIALHDLEDDAQRKFAIRQRMLFLTNNPKYQKGSTTEAAKPSNTPQELALILKLTRAIRQQDSQTAIPMLRDASTEMAIDKWPGEIDWQQLKQWSRQVTIDDITLIRLLELELQVVKQLDRSAKIRSWKRASWSIQSTLAPHRTALPYRLDSVLPEDFDVKATLFRDGKWQPQK